MKVRFYTSCYSKMLKRHKSETDMYIQVSRSLFMPKRNIDGISMQELIDVNFGEQFGMYADTLQEYERDMREFFDKDGDMEELKEGFTPELFEKMATEDSPEDEKEALKDVEFNVFLLCYEDLDTKYTKKDEEKYGGDIRAGEYKTCHRTILAKILNEKYHSGITEYKEP